MNHSKSRTTFRGLPLTPEQDSSIKHYIHVRQRCGTPWETPELEAMLADMLEPPELSSEDSQSLMASTAAEQVTALNELAIDDTARLPSDMH